MLLQKGFKARATSNDQNKEQDQLKVEMLMMLLLMKMRLSNYCSMEWQLPSQHAYVNT